MKERIGKYGGTMHIFHSRAALPRRFRLVFKGMVYGAFALADGVGFEPTVP